MKHWWKLAVLALALLGLVACGGKKDDAGDGGDGSDSGAATTTDDGSGATLTKMEFSIDGMSCGVACPPKVRSQFVKMDGVKDCEVSYDNKTAYVTCSKEMNAEEMAKAIGDGFTATAKN